MRRVSVVVLSVLLMLALACSSVALAAPPDGKGQPRAEEEKQKGKPENPNGFGNAASHQAHSSGGLGQHARDPEGDGPGSREGVGNVARNDGAPGDHPGDHGCLVGEQMGTSTCGGKPGKG